VARENGVDLRVIRSAVEVNDSQVERMVRKIEEGLGGLKGKRIGVLGLSFKPNTSDIRESPAMRIITALLDLGASVRAYDPVAMPEARTLLESVEMGSDAYDTATGCDALVLATEWNQFRNLDLARLKELMRSPVLIDLRNVYEPGDMTRLGFRYAAVGR
jgi:UDPglucose 6-dehydrogenase